MPPEEKRTGLGAGGTGFDLARRAAVVSLKVIGVTAVSARSWVVFMEFSRLGDRARDAMHGEEAGARRTGSTSGGRFGGRGPRCGARW